MGGKLKLKGEKNENMEKCLIKKMKKNGIWKRNFLSFHCLVGLKTVKKENKYDFILFYFILDHYIIPF